MRDDTVTVMRPPRRRPRRASRVSGEELRRQLEARIDTRDPNEIAEPEAA
jgi:hypothetical protein